MCPQLPVYETYIIIILNIIYISCISLHITPTGTWTEIDVPSFADVHRHLHALVALIVAFLATAQEAGVVTTAPRATEVGALPYGGGGIWRA